MTKKKAFQMALFVGIGTFAFSSFVVWELFQRIGPTASGFRLLDTLLPFTPFLLSGSMGFVVFNVAHQVLSSQVGKTSD